MLHNVFSVYDEKAEAYLPVFQLPTSPMATRIFGECVNSREHQFGKHPGDYTLFLVGTFNDETGEINYYKKTLGNGLEFKKPQESVTDTTGATL